MAATDGVRLLFPVQKLLDSLQARSGTSSAVRLSHRGRYRAGPVNPRFTVVFRSDAALLQALARGHLALLESYFDSEGAHARLI